MLIKNIKSHQVSDSDITPEQVYKNRREIVKALGLGIGAVAVPQLAHAQESKSTILVNKSGQKLKYTPSSTFKEKSKDLKVTSESKAVTYNNFYELGTSKTDPAENAHFLKTTPWTLTVSGEVDKPFTLDVWDLINKAKLEERVYRMRCVEAWSMVIPWLGIGLADIIKQSSPTSKAKYVAFESIVDRKNLPGQASEIVGGGIDYPYIEGLRIDEAMNNLSFLAVGMYGKTLPNQNGAPIRLVVPWKYGFKNIKSIVSIRLVETMPKTSWNLLASNEYGFYANVNPNVDHPRWSQASERFIGAEGVFGSKRQKTLMFNGYTDEVASMYSGMDLTKQF